MRSKKPLGKLIVFALLTGLLLLIGHLTGADQLLPESQGVRITLRQAGAILLMICATLCVENLLLLALSFLNPKGHRARTTVALLGNMVKYAAAIVIICGVLALLNVDIVTILAGLGIIALIIGFGAESLVTDVVTGMFILLDNQYNVGDIIEVSGFRGTVSDIGIRTTSLVDTGGNVKIINNSDMKNILNRSDNASKAVADFFIPYETDLEKLEEKIPALLEQIYQLHTDVMAGPPKYLGVQELGASSIVLRFVVEVGESDIYSGARLLNHDLLLGFRRLGVECPYQQVDVHNK